ncbi:MAG: hypothetical protein HY332_05185 [Chloroflexi bacterium]|nr:hypothetical protein [Chloroflexota bacterium]
MPLLSAVLLGPSAPPPPTLAGARPPDWAGWLGLIVLVAASGLLAWWLFASPLPRPVEPVAPPEPVLRALQVRRHVAAVVLLSGLLLQVGARWDELWHRLYGLPFGEDLLWPPHLLMYASFALNLLLVAYGLSVALRGHGSLRARFRREPLLALLGLLSAYMFAFIPVDIVWHQVIGPDLSAESPPHVVMALSVTAVALTGVALALSTAPRPAWRSLVDRPRTVDVLALGILALLSLNWLQLLTTSWEWADDIVLGRPGWTYPVTVLVIGAAFAHLALYSTRRVGAATAIALVDLAVYAPTVALYRLFLPPGPVVAAPVLLVPAAVALDAWYALRARGEATRSCFSFPGATHWRGALLYGAVFLAVAFPYIARAMAVPALDPPTALASVAAGLQAVLIASLLSARIGTWLGEVGRGPATEPRSLHPHTRARE